MKLKKHEAIGFKCDKCGGLRKHKDMFDECICYDCWYKENERNESI